VRQLTLKIAVVALLFLPSLCLADSVPLTSGQILFNGDPQDFGAFLQADGYSIENLISTNIFSLFSICQSGCSTTDIMQHLQFDGELLSYHGPGSMAVNGQTVGMFGGPTWMATSFVSSLSGSGIFSVTGTAITHGVIGDASNGRIFSLDGLAWTYTLKFEGSEANGFSYDYVFIESQPIVVAEPGIIMLVLVSGLVVAGAVWGKARKLAFSK
jgi:hypothetical protein